MRKRLTFFASILLITVVVVVSLAFVKRPGAAEGTGMKAQGLPAHKIALIESSDPGFLSTSRSFKISDEAKQAIDQFSVMVVNNSSRQITGVSLVWEFTRPNGTSFTKTISQASMDNLFTVRSRPLISPGTKLLFSLVSEVRLPFTDKDMGEKMTANLEQAAISLKRTAERSKSWRLFVDGVMFADGTYVGPDTSGYFAALLARTNAPRDLLKEMKNKQALGGERAVIDHLQLYANVTKQDLKKRFANIPPPHIDNPEYAYQLTKIRYAKRFVDSYKEKGFKPIASWMDKYGKNAPVILRKQE